MTRRKLLHPHSVVSYLIQVDNRQGGNCNCNYEIFTSLSSSTDSIWSLLDRVVIESFGITTLEERSFRQMLIVKVLEVGL
jgi:hypothetical protein